MNTKHILTLTLILSAAFSAFSQSYDYIPKRTIWGIKGNLNAELPGKWKGSHESVKMYNSGFGASIGGLANVYLGKNFYFEPELALFYTGYSYDKIYIGSPNSPAVNDGPKIYKFGVRVPLMVGYEWDISDKWGLRVFTGPQLSYGLAGKVKTNIEEFKQDEGLMTLYSNKDYGQRRFDLGWKVGVGFPVNHFLISLEGDFGLTNLHKNPQSSDPNLKPADVTFRENRVSLGITYYFLP